MKITHENILTSLMAVKKVTIADAEINDIYIAYLPLAHVFELANELIMIISGIKIGYSSPHTMTDLSTAIKRGQKGDLNTLKPTLMAAVPSILERLTKAIKDKLKEGSPFKTFIFNKAYEIKLNKLKQRKSNILLNTFIFNKINCALLGGRLKIIVTGGSILNEDVHEFCQVCLCNVIQIYGMSETCGGGTSQFYGETTVNEVGE